MIHNTDNVQATVERFITGNKWHMMFAPLSTIPTTIYSTEGAYTNKNIYSFNETAFDYWNSTTSYGTSGWTAIYSNPTLPTNQGYIFDRYGMADKTFSQIGGILQDQDQILSISYTTNGTGSVGANGVTQDWTEFDGWNLIGNPFACAIDWTQVADDADIENGIYIWDPSASNYKYFMNVSGTAYNTGIGINQNGSGIGNMQYIPSGQAFFVKAKQTGSITIPKSARTHTTHSFWKSGQTQISDLFRMNIAKDGYTDETVLWTNPAATDGHDADFDLYKKFSMDGTKPQVYTFTTENQFALNTFPKAEAGKQIPVAVKIGEAGTYTFNFTENTYQNLHTYFEDKLLDQTINTRSVSSYSFDASVPDSVTDRFVLHFEMNHAPVGQGTIEDQFTDEKTPYIFTPDAGFTDEDNGDIITCSATLENGNPLPAWLNFDTDTKTFSGTPGNEDVGIYFLKLVGTDLLNAQTSIDFVLTVNNVNDAPTLENAIPNQIVNQDAVYNFTIPANTFKDIDAGDILTYSASYPEWMQFDAATGTFTGTPGNSEVGIYNISVTATDLSFASVSNEFYVEVLNINDAPTVANAIPDQTVPVNNSFLYQIPENTFTDIDQNDSLTYSAQIAGGFKLPEWLNFEPSTRILSGTPTETQELNIEVTATDNFFAGADDVFKLSVLPTVSVVDLSGNRILIYPNPCNDKFNIRFGSVQQNSTINVTNVNGILILSEKINSDRKQIDMSRFAKGIYFIEIKTDKSAQKIKLILN
jgi:hypothetical protein